MRHGRRYVIETRTPAANDFVGTFVGISTLLDQTWVYLATIGQVSKT